MTDTLGKMMFDDLKSQTAAIDAVVRSFYKQSNLFDRSSIRTLFTSEILLTGCGATYAMALTTASLYRSQGFKATAIPASELFFYPEMIPCGSSVIIAFSRSGETSETIKAIEQFRRQRPKGIIIAITTNLHSSLALSADLILDSSDACDTSIIETKSFSGMFMLAQLLCAWMQKDDNRLCSLGKVTSQIESYMVRIISAAERLANNAGLNRFFFLGSGPLFGIAYQASLTLKECTASWSEAFQPLEFRHGPRTMATTGSFICLFASEEDAIASQENRVIEEMKDQGACTLVFTDRKNVFSRFSENEVFHFVASEAEDCVLIMLGLIFSQWFAYFKSVSNGLNPDKPDNLKSVTKL